MRYASILCALTEGRGSDARTRLGRSDGADGPRLAGD